MLCRLTLGSAVTVVGLGSPSQALVLVVRGNLYARDPTTL